MIQNYMNSTVGIFLLLEMSFEFLKKFPNLFCSVFVVDKFLFFRQKSFLFFYFSLFKKKIHFFSLPPPLYNL